MTDRITWDEYFINVADLASVRSPCNRLKVGCVLVKKLIHNDYDVEQNGGAKIIFCYYHTKSQKHINEHKRHWNCEVVPTDGLTELAEMAEVVEAAENLSRIKTL